MIKAKLLTKEGTILNRKFFTYTRFCRFVEWHKLKVIEAIETF